MCALHTYAYTCIYFHFLAYTARRLHVGGNKRNNHSAQIPRLFSASRTCDLSILLLTGTYPRQSAAVVYFFPWKSRVFYDLFSTSSCDVYFRWSYPQ